MQVVGIIYGVEDQRPRPKECVYTGSTEVSHWKRWGQHLEKAFSEATEHLPFYRYLRQEGPEHFLPVVLEQVTDVSTLRERERWHQDRINPRCNVRKAFLTEEEKVEYHRGYYRDNIEKWAVYRENRLRKLKAKTTTTAENDNGPG